MPVISLCIYVKIWKQKYGTVEWWSVSVIPCVEAITHVYEVSITIRKYLWCNTKCRSWTPIWVIALTAGQFKSRGKKDTQNEYSFSLDSGFFFLRSSSCFSSNRYCMTSIIKKKNSIKRFKLVSLRKQFRSQPLPSPLGFAWQENVEGLWINV